MKEEKKYSGSKTRNYFTAYLLASIQGRRLRYLEKQQKILLRRRIWRIKKSQI
nr:hypothetical protein [Mediterraneibacter faecis]